MQTHLISEIMFYVLLLSSRFWQNIIWSGSADGVPDSGPTAGTSGEFDF